MSLSELADVLKGHFGQTDRAKVRLDDMTALFIEWAAPALDAAHMQGEQRTIYETICRDLAHQLATAYSDLGVRIRLPDHHSPEDVARLREDVREAMMELYLRMSGIAVITLRRALIAAFDANRPESAP
jgi:hypothetical protein